MGDCIRDCIRLRDIVCYGYTGVLPEERILGQRFVVDLDLETDLQPAGASDNLADTIDYLGVIEQVRTTVETSRFQLIEALAAALAEQIRADPRVRRVRVAVTKPQPPIPHFTGSVAVEIWR